MELVDISEEKLARESSGLLKLLLIDRTTKKNIVWATNSYEYLGEGFGNSDFINKSNITANYKNVIQPRSKKALDEQKDRTKSKGEVFTPTWIVKKQVNIANDELKSMPLKDYINIKWLEIACGEAPYMISRYDSITGEVIEIPDRVGFLDLKMHRIYEETESEEEFLMCSEIAYKSSYGYEFQGDSLLLARENLLASFIDYFSCKFGKEPPLKNKKRIAEIISYNIVQMNGLSYTTPYSSRQSKLVQLSFFNETKDENDLEEYLTKIKNWQSNEMINFKAIPRGEKSMKFDVVIGNPPYQEEAKGKSTKDMPIYHRFMDESRKIAGQYILISPARFLFNAGGTPKQWNKDMLSDTHIKVMYYEQDSSKLFPSTDIKGGVAITYYNCEKDFGAIDTFTHYTELDSIMKKVAKKGFESIAEIVANRGIYRYSDIIYKEQSELMRQVSDRRLASNAFNILESLFYDKKPSDGFDYVGIIGRYDNERVIRWFRKDYMNNPFNFDKYKIIIPKANGSGAIGEVLSTPLIGEPLIGHTETFISIGAFDTEGEAVACLKYIKCKFTRALLGILKITQDNSKETWRKVPIQDFTSSSDIDWNQSISDIDKQLYGKYGLSSEEISFIETKVKEMD